METDFIRKKKPADYSRYKRWALALTAIAGLLVILTGLMWGLATVFPQRFSSLSSGFTRAKNLVTFTILGAQPQFYYLDIEKNGKVYRLTPRDSFEVTYKDEFIITGVTSDDLRGKGVTVDLDGTGRRNDFRVLMKGVEFVDRVMKQGRKADTEPAGGDYRIHVRYLEREIGAIPLKVTIMPQDWLRYAQGSSSERQQIDYLKRAIATNPGDTGIRKVLAGIYYRLGMIREAVEEYQTVLKLNPEDAGALKELARCYQSQKNYEQAIGVYRRLLIIQPNDQAVYASMGMTYAAMGAWSKAVAAYQQALQINPEDGNVHFKLGQVYEATNKKQEAIAEYQIALNKNPAADEIVLALANANLKAGKQDEAIKWYKEVLKRQPRNAMAYANMGLAYGNKGVPAQEM